MLGRLADRHGGIRPLACQRLTPGPDIVEWVVRFSIHSLLPGDADFAWQEQVHRGDGPELSVDHIPDLSHFNASRHLKKYFPSMARYSDSTALEIAPSGRSRRIKPDV